MPDLVPDQLLPYGLDWSSARLDIRRKEGCGLDVGLNIRSCITVPEDAGKQSTCVPPTRLTFRL